MRTHPTFSAFLTRHAEDASLEDWRFVPRNFLLDAGVADSRAASYAPESPGFTTLEEWEEGHRDYLFGAVHLEQPRSGLPKVVDPARASTCAETFRPPGGSLSALGLAEDLDLVRVERVDSLARRAGIEPAVVEDGVVQYLASSPDPSGPEGKLLDAMLLRWSRSLDLRPVFAALWDDCADLLPTDKALARDDWADALRDRLGLAHYDPSLSGPIDVLILRYSVRGVPRSRAVHTGRPLAAPTVLDGAMSPAFCPAPRGADAGQSIDLASEGLVPAREILHPPFRWGARHVFRYGTVSRGVGASLDDARMWHLLCIRDDPAQSDYGGATDGDLLR